MTQIAYTTSLETDDFEPYIEDGHRLGDVHWLRRDFEGDKPVLQIGIMRAEEGTLPEAFEYFWENNEVIQILSGELVIEIEDGSTVHLRPGDVGSFRKGHKAVFKAKGAYKQFFVMHG